MSFTPENPATSSSVIAVAEHCPAAMLKDTWSLAAFDIRAKLYAGHISSVYRAVDRNSGITVGLKLYRRTMLNDMERHQIAREIWLHIQLNHPSIIALYAAWKDKDYIYLVLEWAPEGNVFTFLQQSGGRLPEGVVVPMILEPTMSALHYTHELIKLADFGLSIHSSYEVANTRLGTIDYLSPEILDCPVKQHPQDHKQNPQKWYTCKVDVWSIGVLAYELLVGRTPFEAVGGPTPVAAAAAAATPAVDVALAQDRTPQETLYKIKTQEVAYPAELSEGAADFIRSALVRDPEQRASLQDLLQHPWLQRHKRSATGPHMRGRTQTQSEVAVHCFGSLAEARCHASSGNMKPAACISSADGAHNSCPQVLHSQMSAPAGQLQAAAAGEAYHIPSFHQPSPLGQQKRKQPTAAAGSSLGSMAVGAVGATGAHASPELVPAGFVMGQAPEMQDGDMEVDATH
ncbi:kinase-like domain-containing protein [Scenedesmus sp. NREL 46B-D3]|nr:kinase-like domain-containing protein [Scenedesmus sp. NREL 46B-D3]